MGGRLFRDRADSWTRCEYQNDPDSDQARSCPNQIRITRARTDDEPQVDERLDLYTRKAERQKNQAVWLATTGAGAGGLVGGAVVGFFGMCASAVFEHGCNDPTTICAVGGIMGVAGAGVGVALAPPLTHDHMCQLVRRPEWTRFYTLDRTTIPPTWRSRWVTEAWHVLMTRPTWFLSTSTDRYVATNKSGKLSNTGVTVQRAITNGKTPTAAFQITFQMLRAGTPRPPRRGFHTTTRVIIRELYKI